MCVPAQLCAKEPAAVRAASARRFVCGARALPAGSRERLYAPPLSLAFTFERVQLAALAGNNSAGLFSSSHRRHSGGSSLRTRTPACAKVRPLIKRPANTRRPNPVGRHNQSAHVVISELDVIKAGTSLPCHHPIGLFAPVAKALDSAAAANAVRL